MSTQSTPLLHRVHPPTPLPPLPLPHILIYSLPSLPYAAGYNFISLLQVRYYTDSYHVPLSSLNIIFIALQFILILLIPLLGLAADNFHSPWGRRKPLIALFGPLVLITIALAMWPPPFLLHSSNSNSNSTTYLTLWFGATYTGFVALSLLFVSPYQALGIELTLDSTQRSRLFGASQTMFQLGVLLSTALPTGLANASNRREVYAWFGASCAALGCLSIALLNTSLPRPNPNIPPPPKNPLIPGLVRSLRNAAFRPLLLAITLLNSQPYYLVLLPFWTKYSLRLDSPGQAAVLTAYMVGAFAAMPLWVLVATKSGLGKRYTYVLALGCGILTFVALIFVPERSVAVAAAAAAAAGSTGAALNGNNFLFQSLLADVIEYDALLCGGSRREAQFANAVQLGNALTSILSVSAPLFVLSSLGYVSDAEQNHSVRTAITLMLGPGAALFLAAAALVILWFPISESVHASLLSALDSHAAGLPAQDPLTGATIPPPSSDPDTSKHGWTLDAFFAWELNLAPRSRLPLLVVLWILVSSLGLAGSIALALVHNRKFIELGSLTGMITFALLLFNLARLPTAHRIASPHSPISDSVFHLHLQSLRTTTSRVISRQSE